MDTASSAEVSVLLHILLETFLKGRIRAAVVLLLGRYPEMSLTGDGTKLLKFAEEELRKSGVELMFTKSAPKSHHIYERRQTLCS